MRRLRTLGLALVGACSAAAAAPAQRTESNFPLEPLHAWPVALGGAGVALRGAEFSLINPAALAGTHGAELSHRASPIGAREYAISVAVGGHWGTIHMAARRRDWGEIAADLGLSDLTVGEQSLSLAYAGRAIHNRLGFGVSFARLDANYLDARTATWAMDAGVQGVVGRGFSLGLALLHAGRGFSGDSGPAPLPARLRPGVAWQGKVRSLRVATALDLPVRSALDAPPDVHAGLEVGGTWGPAKAAVRTGYRSLVNRDAGGSRQGAWALGGGLNVRRIAVDIAYTFGVVFGDERFVSLSIRW